jgi:hypothetical protein
LCFKIIAKKKKVTNFYETFFYIKQITIMQNGHTAHNVLVLQVLKTQQLHYHAKWANALLESAILCVSSFFFTAGPSPFAESISKSAKSSLTAFPFPPLAKVMIHLIARANCLSAETGIGTW